MQNLPLSGGHVWLTASGDAVASIDLGSFVWPKILRMLAVSFLCLQKNFNNKKTLVYETKTINYCLCVVGRNAHGTRKTAACRVQ